MDEFRKKCSWDVVAAKLRNKYANMTDSDLLLSAGSEKEIFGMPEKKFEELKEEICNCIKWHCIRLD